MSTKSIIKMFFSINKREKKYLNNNNVKNNRCANSRTLNSVVSGFMTAAIQIELERGGHTETIRGTPKRKFVTVDKNLLLLKY